MMYKYEALTRVTAQSSVCGEAEVRRGASPVVGGIVRGKRSRHLSVLLLALLVLMKMKEGIYTGTNISLRRYM